MCDFNPNSIIQWNPNGITNKIEELHLMINQIKPLAICLQETHLKFGNKFSLKNYQVYRNDVITDHDERAKGGVAILIHNNYSSVEIEIDTDLQAVAVEIYYPIKTTLISLYLPNDNNITISDIEHLITQLTTPFIILGDFNAHHPLWDRFATRPDKRGTNIVNLIDKYNLNILNNGEPTHYTYSNGTVSAIDITIASPIVSMYFDWHIYQNLCSSDHFPIILSTEIPTNAASPPPRPRWKINQANWQKYNLQLNLKNDYHFHDPDIANQYIVDEIRHAAINSIPISSTNCHKPPVPWWSRDISEMLKARWKAQRNAIRNPSPSNLHLFRKCRALARKRIRIAKRLSWQKFVNNLGQNEDPQKIWRNIKAIQGIVRFKEITTIITNGQCFSEPLEIANILANHFSTTSQTNQYSNNFINIKTTTENMPFMNQNCFSNNGYNKEFNINQLTQIMKTCRGSTPGPDGIHYKMLTNLNIKSKLFLLKFYNNLWTNHTFPNEWLIADVIPINKTGKDKKSPLSYRPIALTNTMCKVMEKLVAERVKWITKEFNLISKFQMGFQKHRSTTDALGYLVNEIQMGFRNGEKIIAIFFDINKAYDKTWKHHILNILDQHGISGNLFQFIKNFLKVRRFKVITNNKQSDTYEQENGVPQGSVLSVILFLIAINPLIEQIESPVKVTMFADDLVIFIRSKNMDDCESLLQNSIDKLCIWTENHGFEFNVGKTKGVVFGRTNRPIPSPNIHLKGQPISFNNNHKYLGVILDQKLSFKLHLASLKTQCLKTLNVIKLLSNIHWGSDRKLLLRVHNALILSRLDYASVIYQNASTTNLKILDTIHTQGLRLSIGAFRSSPVESIICDSGSTPLSYRRAITAINFITKISTYSDHPLQTKALHALQGSLFADPIFKTILFQIQNYNLILPNLMVLHPRKIPPWELKSPIVIKKLLKFPKNMTNNYIYHTEFKQIQDQYKNFQFIYVDGSKTNDRVGVGIYHEIQQEKYKLSNIMSIYSAEAVGLQIALSKACRSNFTRFVIVSDSYSSLVSLQNSQINNPIIQDIQEKLHSLYDKNIIFLWVPSHSGIFGNEQADSLSKSAVNLHEIIQDHVPFNDQKKHVRNSLMEKWNGRWNECIDHKLYEIKTTTAPWETSLRESRYESVIVCRLRIGHTRYTHDYLMKKCNPPQCDICHCPITIQHILINCPKYNHQRRKTKISPNLKEALGDNEKFLRCTLKFIKAIGFISHI